MWVFADDPPTSTVAKRCASSVAVGDSDRLVNPGNNLKHHPISNGIDQGIIDNPPKLFDAINKHGLTIFLLVRHHFLLAALISTELFFANSFRKPGKCPYRVNQPIDSDNVYE